MSKNTGIKVVSLFVGMLICMALVQTAFAAWNTPNWNSAKWKAPNWDASNWSANIGNSTTYNITTSNTTIMNTTSSSIPLDLTNVSTFADIMKALKP
jgi:hypothetical protein